jgi:hypothetical protein
MKGKLVMAALAVVTGLMIFGFIPARATDTMAPDDVVAEFYAGYLDYIGAGEVRQNPLVDRAYRSSEFLSDSFIAEIDELLASNQLFFDPILLAQDVPVKVEAGEATVSDDEASVVVEVFWGGNPTPSERIVTLKMVEGQWKITGVDFAQ